MPHMHRWRAAKQPSFVDSRISRDEREPQSSISYSWSRKQLQFTSGLPITFWIVALCSSLLARRAVAQLAASTVQQLGDSRKYEYNTDPDLDAATYTSDTSSAWEYGSRNLPRSRPEPDQITGTTRQLYRWYNASHPPSGLSAKGRCLAGGFSSKLQDRSVFSQVGAAAHCRSASMWGQASAVDAWHQRGNISHRRTWRMMP
jgi:hypothetical protein